MIFADIDHFKTINDTHGHGAGDVVLQEVAMLMSRLVRGDDLVCRYGGEEFVLLLNECDLDSARLLAERIRQHVQRLDVVYDDQTLPPITLSFGIGTYPSMTKKREELLGIADSALYQAKRRGRNRVEIGRRTK